MGNVASVGPIDGAVVIVQKRRHDCKPPSRAQSLMETGKLISRLMHVFHHFCAGNESYTLSRTDISGKKNGSLPAFGIRIPLGINYMIPRSPVKLTLELAPLVVISPGGGFGFDGGLAVRFYP